MKRKYTSFIMVLLILLSLGLGITYELHLSKTESSQGRNRRVAPLSEINVPDKPVLAKMDRLERRMHLLSIPPPRVVRRTDLAALGYVPVAHPQTGVETGGSPWALSSAHRLTLAFDGRGKRFCMIDRKLYPEGGVLPDGAVIIKIESRRVLIAKESLQQWLAVDPLIGAAEPDKSS